MPSLRRTLLITAMLLTTVVLVILGAITVLWISMGGTFRGEDASVGTVIQIGSAVMSCVGLAFLIRFLLRAARRA